jgi:hypothetical protein
MGERPDQIEQHIRQERSVLEQNFSQLEAKVKDAFDWKTQFQQHPGMLLGAAFVGGALLAAIVPKSASDHDDDDEDRTVASRARAFSEPVQASAEESSAPSSAYSAYTKTRSATSDTWDTLKAAAIGLATTRISEYVDQLVPGFTEHYKKAAAGNPSTPFSSVPTPKAQQSYARPNGGTDYASHS